MKFENNAEMKQMIDLQKEYSVQPVMQMDYAGQVNQNFAQGKVAMIQQGDWIYETVNQIDA
ncbi:carbohydrate ABC transporter substrate-binding protein, partial [Staphylococcus epidermidis]